jgi:DNA repair exonuclease SbcCD ATPase subunit
MPAEQRAELVHKQLQKQQDLLEAAVHRAAVARQQVVSLGRQVRQLQGQLGTEQASLTAAEEERDCLQEQLRGQQEQLSVGARRWELTERDAACVREQLRQQKWEAAQTEAAWRERYRVLEAQLKDALSAKAALESSWEADAQARMQQWAQAQQWRAMAILAEMQLSQAGLQIARLQGQLDRATVAASRSRAASMVQQSRAAAPEAVAWQPPPPRGLPPQPLPASSGVPLPPPSAPPGQLQLQIPQAGAALIG